MRKLLFCFPLISLCSGICLFATGCGGGGGGPSAPPAAITGLSYVRTHDAPETVRLTWSPGATRTTKGYLVARKFQGETRFLALTKKPITTAGFEDKVPAGKDLVTAFYQVVLVDKKDRVSAPVEIPGGAVVSPPGAPF